MIALLKKLRKLENEHPYLMIIIGAIIGSIIGIVLEYIINRDFQINGIWGILSVVATMCLIERHRRK